MSDHPVHVNERVAWVTRSGELRDGVVKHVWDRATGDDRPPLINITVNGLEHTSVPHRSDVPGASGYFWVGRL